MNSLLALLRLVWVRLFKLYAIRGNVVEGRKALSDAPKGEARRPAYTAPRMMGWGAALLVLAAVAGVTVLGIRSTARTATNVPTKAGVSEAALASDHAATIEDEIRRSGPGATIVIRPGLYRISDLVLTPNTTLYAPQGAIIVGRLVARGPNTVVRGFTFSAGTIDISNSQSVTIGECAFDGETTAINLDGASNALVINNDFHNVAGNVITGWGLDRSTISGNHFFDCGQCINLDFNNDPTRGRNIVIERNVFIGTARMAVEVGPLEAYTENLVVRDNWAADFKNRGPDPGETMSTFVAYSIVPTHGVNTVITRNYATAGARGRGAIGIELDGSGKIARNYIQDFDYGAIVYGAGFNVHHNAFVATKYASVLNYAKRPGRIAHDGAGQQMPVIARPPERRVWPL